MALEKIKLGSYTWYNYPAITKKELGKIHADLDIAHLHLKMALPKEQRPKFIKTEKYIFFITHYPVFNKKTRKMREEEIDVFMGKDYIITIHNNFYIINELFKLLQKDPQLKEKKFDNDPSKLIHDIILKSTDTVWSLLDVIAGEINVLKEQIFNVTNNRLILRILHLKTTIATMRKSLQFQKGILKRLSHQASDIFPSPKARERFARVIDVNDDLWQYLETYNDVINAIDQSHQSAFNFYLNNILKTLTIISFIILPLTLTAGILGMRNLPEAYATTEFFWPIIGTIILIIFILVVIFRKKKWL